MCGFTKERPNTALHTVHKIITTSVRSVHHYIFSCVTLWCKNTEHLTGHGKEEGVR